MNLISILLISTAILVILTGLVTLVGAARGDRSRMTWFFVATLGIAVWSLSIAGFLGMSDTVNPSTAKIFVYGIYLSALVAVPALLGYSAWEYTSGKALTVFFFLLSGVFSALLLSNPSLLYDEIVIDRTANNSVSLVGGWFYLAYFIYFCVCFSLYLGILLYRAKHTKNKNVRAGDFLLLGGMTISSGFTCLFDLILPYFGHYGTIWVGPIVISIVMVIFFYAIIKYRIITVESRWMRILSYVVMTAVGVIVYMLLFYTIFTALFKIPNPSTAVLVLNFLMIVIVLLMMPVINELSASLRSLILVGQVDIAYVIKKLNRLAAKNVNLHELAEFLAGHLHFAYIGFIINGRLYGSKPLAMSAEEITQIAKLKAATGGSVWQKPNAAVEKIFDELSLTAVAELSNAKGKAYGQLVVGKPVGKSSFEKRDLLQLEMIINLVATVIDSEKHLRA